MFDGKHTRRLLLVVIVLGIFAVWFRASDPLDLRSEQTEGLRFESTVLNDTATLEFELENPLRFRSLRFTNTDEKPAKLRFNFNDDRTFMDLPALVADIRERSTSDTEVALELYKLVAYEYKLLGDPTADYRVLDKPANYFCAFNVGWCGHKAAMLVLLAKAAGLEARVIDLNKHAISEIYYENAWHMFDSHLGLFFAAADGHLMSFEEVYPRRKELLANTTGAQEAIDNNYYENPKDATAWVESLSVALPGPVDNMWITLAPGASFEILSTDNPRFFLGWDRVTKKPAATGLGKFVTPLKREGIVEATPFPILANYFSLSAPGRYDIEMWAGPKRFELSVESDRPAVTETFTKMFSGPAIPVTKFKYALNDAPDGGFVSAHSDVQTSVHLIPVLRQGNNRVHVELREPASIAISLGWQERREPAPSALVSIKAATTERIAWQRTASVDSVELIVRKIGASIPLTPGWRQLLTTSDEFRPAPVDIRALESGERYELVLYPIERGRRHPPVLLPFGPATNVAEN